MTRGLTSRRRVGQSRTEGEDHRTGFDADVLVGQPGDRNARPDTVGHQHGAQVFGRHRDLRMVMRFIDDADQVPLRVEHDAGRPERRQPDGLCPIQRPAMTWISARASNASSRRSMMVIGRILELGQPDGARGGLIAATWSRSRC